MSEMNDPAIKLFGKTISSPQNEPVPASVGADHNPDRQSSSNSAISEDIKNASGEDFATENKHEDDDDDSSNPAAEDSTQPGNASGNNDDHKTSGAENEISSPNDEQRKEDPGDNNSSQEKTLKKPDKILPCPRCHSMDTKFCYYNNYNVNQPRHFCKNCQRYWTAGGTMRNVPVGSGRRKNKNSCPSHYRHIMVPDALHAPRTDVPNGIHFHNLKANGTILAFGSERPLCESMASVLNLTERSQNHVPNGFHEPKIAIPSAGGKEIGKDRASANSTITSNSSEKGIGAESVMRSSHAYIPQPPPIPGLPWPYPWNSAQWRTQFSPPALGSSGFPITFYPAPAPPYWGCAPPYWGVAPLWLSPAPSSPDHSALSSGPTSPTLGKHTREGEILSPSNQAKEEPFERKDGGERSILIPKTLRIDDRNEAAKSSIWSTLGIKNEKIHSGSINGLSLFKAFPAKGEFKNRVADNSLVLQANPAAFSRSQSFHEST